MSLAIFFPFQHQIKKRKEKRVAKAKKSLFAILLENEGRSSIISLPSSLLARRSQSHVSCILNQFPSSQTRTVLRATSLLLMDPGLHFQNDTKGKRNYCSLVALLFARKVGKKNENFFGGKASKLSHWVKIRPTFFKHDEFTSYFGRHSV